MGISEVWILGDLEKRAFLRSKRDKPAVAAGFGRTSQGQRISVRRVE